jgi:hypothetical protein
MKHFTEPDFNDLEFPHSSERMRELKHNPKEVDSMCKSVEAYAEKREIRRTVRDGLSFGATKEQIIFRLIENYELDEDVAQSYYEEFSSQTV